MALRAPLIKYSQPQQQQQVYFMLTLTYKACARRN